MNEIKLGQLIEVPGVKKDAIHIAIAPVTAGENLKPGDRIGFLSDSTVAAGATHPKLGIVDPFLTHDVRKGQRFYMLLFPNTITSLRHEWTHPNFKEQETVALEDEMVANAKEWIEYFAESIDVTYSHLMAAAGQYLIDGKEIFNGSNDSYNNVSKSEWNRFWDYYEIVNGVKVNNKDTGAIFHCAC